MASKRILKELKDLQKEPPTSCTTGRTVSKVVGTFRVPTCYLKAKLEEAISGHNLFDEKIEEPKKINEATERNNKEEEVKKEGADEEGVEPVKEQGEKKTEEETSVGEEKDVSLWGIPLLPSKDDEGTDVVLLKFLRARELKEEQLEIKWMESRNGSLIPCNSSPVECLKVSLT